MKRAVYAPNFNDYGSPARLVELAIASEQAGYDGFFIWDHLVFEPAGTLEIADATTTLGAIAAVTSSIRLGAMVTPVARRRPWKLAREWVSLDHLSKGRLICGVGLGEPAELEFAAFGEDPSARSRAEHLDEGLALVDALSRGERVQHSGQHYRVNEIRFSPSSYQQPRFPIWGAASLPAKAGVRRAMRWDGLFPVVKPADLGLDSSGAIDWSKWWLDVEQFAELVAEVRAARSSSSPFDFVASGRLGEGGCNGVSCARYADIGASWWCDWVDERSGRAADNLARVRAGPTP